MRSPFSDAPLDLTEARRLSLAVRTLADPSRLQILNMLHRADGELTMTDLIRLLGRLSQPTMSHHMRLLVAAGFVTRHQRGVCVYHRLAPAGIAAVAGTIHPGGER